MLKRYHKLAVIIVIILLFITYQRYFFTLNRLGPGDFFQGPVISPTEKYTANAYYQGYGGAAGGVITNKQTSSAKELGYHALWCLAYYN